MCVGVYCVVCTCSSFVVDVMVSAEVLDELWLFLGGAGVFFMQTGFGMLESGSIRAKNVANVLLKNLMDACSSAIAFWAFGYAFAYGAAESVNAFIGNKHFFLSREFTKFGMFFFQYAFAATASTIVSGAVCERTKFVAYLIYSFVITAFIYPVVVHWFWSDYGWLSPFNDGERTTRVGRFGVLDFAGSGVVHMTGGIAGFIGAWIVGPRTGRFTRERKSREIPGHDSSLVVLGTFVLWFGWFFFNSASTLAFSSEANARVALRAAVNTVLAPSAAALTLFVFLTIKNGSYDLTLACNAILAGLVSITSGCSIVEPYGAAIIGCIGAFVYYLGHVLVQKLGVDDPLDAAAVHGFSGIWGLVSVGFFATKQDIHLAYDFDDPDAGVFYGGSGHQLGMQIFGVVMIIIFVGALSFLLFYLIKITVGMRVSKEVEREGLDPSHSYSGIFLYDPIYEEPAISLKLKDPETGEFLDDDIQNPNSPSIDTILDEQPQSLETVSVGNIGSAENMLEDE